MSLSPLALLAMLGIPLLLGEAALRAMRIPREGVLARVGWAYGAGGLLLGMVLWSGLWLGLPLTPLPVCGALAGVTGILLWIGRKPLAPPEPQVSTSRLQLFPGERLLFRVTLLLCLIAGADRIVESMSRATALTDESHIWTAKARVLWEAGGFGESYGELLTPMPLPEARHPDYPPLNPLLQLWSFVWAGEPVSVENRLPVLGFGLALTLVLAAALRRRLRPALAALLLLVTTAHEPARFLGGHAYADVMVAFGVLLVLDGWLRYQAQRRVAWLWLAATGMGIALWSKNEGLLLAACALAAGLLFVAIRRLSGGSGGRRRRGGLSFAAAAPLVLPAALVAAHLATNAAFGHSNDLVGGGATSVWILLGEQLGERLAPLAGAALREAARSGLVWLPLLLVPGLPHLRGRGLGLPAATAGLAWLGLHLVYVGSHHALSWHLETSYQRVVYQGLPALLLWVGTSAAILWPWLRRQAADEVLEAAWTHPRQRLSLALTEVLLPATRRLGAWSARGGVWPALGLLAALSLGAALSAQLRPSLPLGGEATTVMMVESLLRDGDWLYEEADLERAFDRWSGGPCGLVLEGPDSLAYRGPRAFSLLALPVFALLGSAGLLALNLGLFIALMVLAYAALGDRSSEGRLFVIAFFVASAAAGYTLIAQPQVWWMLCLFAAAFLWLREGSREDGGSAGAGIAAGGLVAAAAFDLPFLALLAVPPLLDLLWRRRWQSLRAALGGAAAVALLLSLATWLVPGARGPAPDAAASEGSHHRVFCHQYPLDDGARFEASGESLARRPVTEGARSRLLALEGTYFLAGRRSGLVAYFPFALVALLAFAIGGEGRRRVFLLATLIGLSALTLWLRSQAPAALAGPLGNPDFAVLYPLFFLLLARRPPRGLLVAGLLAAAVWTLPVLTAPFADGGPYSALGSPQRLARFQLFPEELTRFGRQARGDYAVGGWGGLTWVVPRESFYAAEGLENGVWVRGATRSEIWVVSRRPLRRLRLRLHSHSPENRLRLTSDAATVRLEFDSTSKRDGTPVELEVAPRASNLWRFYSREHYHRILVETTDGRTPQRPAPALTEPRYLGVFLQVEGFEEDSVPAAAR